MIYALTRRANAFGIGDYLSTDGADIRGLVTLLSYEQVFDDGRLPIGAYLFAGLDQITATELEMVTRAREALASASPSTPRFNDPLRWRPRLALLRAAVDGGFNNFRATRATDRDRHRRFPVFIRSELEHTGSLSPLLFDQPSVTRALVRALLDGYRLRDLLIIEYSDTSVDGVFTKYSAMALGSRIVPRAVATSREWVTKHGGSDSNREAADRDLRYVEGNPHEAWVRRVFEIGGVDYGRIDYALVNGAPQVWEINTNPTIGANLALEESSAKNAPLAPGGADDSLYYKERGNRLFYQKFGRAIQDLSETTKVAMAADGVGSKPVRIAISSAERRRISRERIERERVLARATMVTRIAAPMLAGYRAIRRAVGPARAGY